jgi:trypsin-like peptidase
MDRDDRFFKVSVCALVFLLLFPFWAYGSPLAEAKQQLADGVGFSWEEARSRSVKILVQGKDRDGNWKRVNIGSGFLISSDGLFVTAYHVMKYCLGNRETESAFAVAVDCSSGHPGLQYIAQNRGGEFEIELISHLKGEESIKDDVQTPDETIKLRDFVIGRLKFAPGGRFPHWQLKDFKTDMVDLARPRADFELRPLVPPRKVFVAGYAPGRDFAIAQGFLNVTEDYHRGYFAADISLYDREYLEAQSIPPDTRWGIEVENHMSGGAVIDFSGSVIGIVVNASGRNAGVLSIENFLETFFSKSPVAGAPPAVLLAPTKTPLYLRYAPAAY